MQQELELNKLYRLLSVKEVSLNRNLGVDADVNARHNFKEPRLAIYGGTANVYCSDKILGEPTSIEQMILDKEDIEGAEVFETLPDFIYLTGDAENIVVTGVIFDEVGEFS